MIKKLFFTILLFQFFWVVGCNIIEATKLFDTESLDVKEYSKELKYSDLDKPFGWHDELGIMQNILSRPKNNHILLLSSSSMDHNVLVLEYLHRFASEKIVAIRFQKTLKKAGNKKIVLSQYIDLFDRAILHYGSNAVYFVEESDILVRENDFANLMIPFLEKHQRIIFSLTSNNLDNMLFHNSVLRVVSPIILNEPNGRLNDIVSQKIKDALSKE